MFGRREALFLAVLLFLLLAVTTHVRKEAFIVQTSSFASSIASPLASSLLSQDQDPMAMALSSAFDARSTKASGMLLPAGMANENLRTLLLAPVEQEEQMACNIRGVEMPEPLRRPPQDLVERLPDA